MAGLNTSLRDFHLSKRCHWWVKPCGILRRVVWYVVIERLQNRNASFFLPKMRGQQSFETCVTVDQPTRRTIVDDNFSIPDAFNDSYFMLS